MKLNRFLVGICLGGSVLLSVAAQAQQSPVVFPELDKAWSKGIFANPAQVRNVKNGLTPSQVRNLIGEPHFNAGFLLSNWNYIFHFHTGHNDDYVTCQFQVQFDKKTHLTSAQIWRVGECEAYIKEKVVQVTAPAPVKQVHPVVLGSDGLFAFGKSDVDNLLPNGRQRLDALAHEVQTGLSNLRGIEVTGHTDLIGSASKNIILSQNRASTVKQYLVSRGLSAALIRAHGAGSSDPLVTCAKTLTKAKRIECLAPNRRIEVVVNGDK